MSKEQAGAMIPSDLNSFVGRQTEIADLRKAVVRNRLIALTGPGGIGKSRLARAVGKGMSADFRDGVAFVDLAAVRSEQHLEQAIRDRVPGYTQASSLHTQLAGRDCLVIIDSCEHLIRPLAHLLSELLAWCPELRVMTTTRIPLGLDGEFRYRVTPLRTADGKPGGLPDAAQLFMERAHSILGSPIPHSQTDDVRRLCLELDGIPLAIELAAAKTMSMSPADIRSRLGARFELLSTDVPAADGSRSLLAVLNWSWERCGDSARRLWRDFAGVFTGATSLRALEAVCSHPNDEHNFYDLVDELIEQSILVRECDGHQVQLRMYDTVRDFANNQATEAQTSSDDIGYCRTVDRHIDYFSELVRIGSVTFFSPDQRRIVNEVNSEIANIRLAFNRCLEHEQHSGRAAEMYTNLWFYWIGCGRIHESRIWEELLLDHHTPVPATNRWVNGWISLLAGDKNQAQSDLEACYSASTESGLTLSRVLSDGLLGAVSAFRGETDAATRRYKRAIADADQSGLQMPVAVLSQQLAEIMAVSGDISGAEAWCEIAAETCSAAEDEWCEAYLIWVRALICQINGDHVMARTWAEKALKGKSHINDILGQALSAEVFAWSLAATGELAMAALIEGATTAYWTATGSQLMGFDALITRREECLTHIRRELSEEVAEGYIAEGMKFGLSNIIARIASASESNCDAQEESGEVFPGSFGMSAGPDPVSTSDRRADVDSKDQSPAEGTAVDSLTARETEVAQLVAHGLTNREIADRLYIGLRTVDTHVANILSKLGLRRRGGVAVALKRNTAIWG